MAEHEVPSLLLPACEKFNLLFALLIRLSRNVGFSNHLNRLGDVAATIGNFERLIILSLHRSDSTLGFDIQHWGIGLHYQPVIENETNECHEDAGGNTKRHPLR